MSVFGEQWGQNVKFCFWDPQKALAWNDIIFDVLIVKSVQGAWL